MSQARKQGTGTDPRLAKALASSKAPAISRAAAVLRLLGKSDSALPLQAIARKLDLVPSTCLYVLRALVAEELVAFDPDTKRYSLEAGVLTLARHWLRRNRFTDLAQPVLDRLSHTHGVTMLGVNIVGLDHIIVVATSQFGPNIQLSAQIGSRFPALISATGRCIAAYGGYSDTELKPRFNNLLWDRPPSFAEWSEQVKATRDTGFAVDEGQYIAGVTVLAAPVWRTGSHLGHAIVAISLTSTLRPTAVSTLSKAMLNAARILSNQLCGESRTDPAT